MGIFSKLFSRSKDDSQDVSLGSEQTLDLSKVYPRLKFVFPNESNNVLTTSDGQTIQLPEDSIPLAVPYCEDLLLTFALDEGAYFSFVTKGHLLGNITVDMVRAAAIKNLGDETKETTQIHGDFNKLIMVTNGGNYEATMVLLDSFMEYIHQEMGDDLYIAIPARDLLYIAPKSNPEAFDMMKSVIEHHFGNEEFANSNHALVRHVYQRTLIDKNLKVVATV